MDRRQFLANTMSAAALSGSIALAQDQGERPQQDAGVRLLNPRDRRSNEKGPVLKLHGALKSH